MSDQDNIKPFAVAKPTGQADVIEMLERWLQQARDGQVQAIALAGVKVGGITSTEWHGLTGGGGFHELNSAITILQYRFLSRGRLNED